MKSIEKIKKLIRNLNLNVDTDSEADKRVLSELLQAQENSRTIEPAFASKNIRRQKMLFRNKAWKVAAVLAVVIGAGTITAAVGIRIYQYCQYRFEGQDRDGAYYFRGESETFEVKDGNEIVYRTAVTVMMDPNEVIDLEQAQLDLEEIHLLRQQDARELIAVIENEVNGNKYRVFRFKYILSDGREMNMNEGDPDEFKSRSPAQREQDNKEIALLRENGERELTRVIDTQVGDEFSRVCTYRYILSDGYQQSVGESDPEQIGLVPVLSPEQIEEVWSLRQLKEGIYLGFEDMEVQGRTFEFETYIFTLSDGTEVIHSVGTPKGIEKIQLTEADLEEFRSLRDAGEYIKLDSEIKEIRGQMFLFEPQLYFLSDGTEYIRSVGEPIEDQ